MIWPFVSRDRYQELAALKDQRIAELEQERKMLWDKICLLGIGAPAFAPMPPEESAEKNDAQSKSTKPAAAVAVSMRPSAIMRRMERLAEARWLRKIYPSRVAENPEFTAKVAKGAKD
ncbi:MAG TPA: hypothetical protein VG649_14325 [Candidatus Angelobacter sp.]|jgi:hypothetical protein|nr:hypothetical protein [Candidatus Angelobacter sp.]